MGIFLLAGFSWLDDVRSQNVWLKLAVQILTAFLVMLSLDAGFPLTCLLSLLCVVFLNSINFMDGLNGLAALVMMGCCLFLSFSGAPLEICLPLFIALLTFLPWNFPKARLFMGDVGSQTCALILCWAAGIMIFSPLNLPFNLRVILLFPALLSGMLFDVFLTLFLRMRHHQPLTQAHNTHLYQKAVRSGFYSPVFVSFIQVFFTVWGGITALFAPIDAILPLLALPQIIWAGSVSYFWKISQKNLP